MPRHLSLAPASGPSSAKGSTRIVLADRHALMRRGMRLLLDGQDGLEVVSEASDLTEVARDVHRHLPDVLVLDLGMPGGSSLEVIRRLDVEAPGTRIVVLTMDEGAGYARQARDAGAVGFVVKDFADVELPEAVRQAARGEQFLSPRVAAGHGALTQRICDDQLTARETEVLRLIAFGHTNAEIAAQLDISRRAVEAHRARIHRKLALATRADLVSYALGRGLLAT